MGVMRRLRDITVATLNEMLENAEDPVQLIDQYLREKSEQMRELEMLARQMNHHTRTLRDRFLHAEKWKEKREEQALLAIKAGEEELARVVLEEKIAYEEESRKYRELYHESKRSLDEVEDLLEQVRKDLQEVSAKRGLYMARLETLRLKQRMNQYLHNGGGKRSIGRSFDRLEERLMEMEGEAEALWQLRRSQRGGSDAWLMGTKAATHPPAQEKGVRKEKLDQELELLKKRLSEEGGRKK